VDLDVLVQIRPLGELFIASIVGAGEGTLSGVHAQVVEEVVPLAELLVTVASVLSSLDGTDQNFDHPLSKRIFGRENEEVSCLGNVLQILNLVVKVFEIELTARGDLDHDGLSGRRYTVELLDLADRQVVQELFEDSELTDRCLERNINCRSYLFEGVVLLVLVRDTAEFVHG
jgi:hypothetical protein